MMEQNNQWDEWKQTVERTDKKVWIITAAVIVILMTVVGLVWYRAGQKNQGQETLCPYRLEQKSSGELVLEIDTSAVKNADWAVVPAESGEERIRTDIKRSRTKVRCSFGGTDMGVTQITLQCRREKPVTETVCRIDLVLSVQEDLSVEALEVTETENVTFQKLDADNAPSCYYLPYTTEAGAALEIRIPQTVDDGWMYVTEGDIAAMSGMRFEETCYLKILPGAQQAQTISGETGESAETPQQTTAEAAEVSEGSVTIYHAQDNIQYHFVIAVMSDNTLKITEASAGSCELREDGAEFQSMDAVLSKTSEE